MARTPRSWDEGLDGRVGGFVLLAGIGLVSTATLLEPAMDDRYELVWWAQLLQMLFWAGASIAALGVLHRRRGALLGAGLTAASFLGAAAVVPWTTDPGVTFAWFVEMLCAIAFAAIVVWAWRVSDPRSLATPPAPAPRPALVSLRGGRATSE